MKTLVKLFVLSALALAACSGPKSYFTQDIRKKLEANSVDLTQLQFYVDRDVVLKRELTSGNLNVTSGKVKMENGKYIHIIVLKKFTPGVCTGVSDKSLDISFEMGDGKTLKFGLTPGAKIENYQILAHKWVNNMGEVTYDGQTYQIQAEGSRAALLIRKSAINTFEIRRHVMKGRKV